MTSHLPTGTVTFVFTDIEGSTRLWQSMPQAMAISHARHNAILREAIQANYGFVFQIVGDSFCAAFHNAADGMRAVLAAQNGLTAETWNETGPLKVRMGLHTGAATILQDGTETSYDGYATLASTQRVMSAAHGGQVLISQTTRDLLQNQASETFVLRDMGEHRLKDLRAPIRLYQLVAPGLPHDFPPIKSLDAFPNNLPAQLTSFIGREKEIADIKRLLYTFRLITLTGSGGTGKSRLAQEVAADVVQNFPHGIWLIELAPVRDPGQIIPAMAQVFGLQEVPFRPLLSSVVDYLRDKKSLVLLDNCEHLIAECARLADSLLHQCAGLVILASSRESLGITGEITYRIPPLAGSESTQLFVDRARAANANFTLTSHNAQAIARICVRLDGIPLAIELAAARVKSLSPEQIASRLDDRFSLLVGGSRTALPRQQTLRALIDWSYDLLSTQEKRLLQMASVFIGGWTLDALEFVSDQAETLEYLEQLVNKSLVVTEERETEMRYFMLETIRQYAREKLFDAGQASLARDRHFFYFNQVSESLWDIVRSSDAVPVVNRAEPEVDNFRAALEWGLENHVDENVRLAANFCTVFSLFGMNAEGVAAARTSVERARNLPPVNGDANVRRQKWIARALFAQGMVGLGVGNYPGILLVLEQAIDIARELGDKLLLGYSLCMYSTLSNFIPVRNGDLAAREGLEIFTREVNDGFGLGMAYVNMARVSANNGEEGEKERYFGKLMEMSHQMPRSFQVGMFFLGMGMYENNRGDYEVARKIFYQGLEIFKSFRGKRTSNFEQVMLSEIGHVERHTGNLAKARLIYSETIQGWQNLGNRSAVAHELECFGFIDLAEGNSARATRLLSAAEALRARIESTATADEQLEFDRAVARLHSMFAEPEFSSLWAQGRELTMEQAVQLALTIELTNQ